MLLDDLVTALRSAGVTRTFSPELAQETIRAIARVSRNSAVRVRRRNALLREAAAACEQLCSIRSRAIHLVAECTNPTDTEIGSFCRLAMAADEYRPVPSLRQMERILAAAKYVRCDTDS